MTYSKKRLKRLRTQQDAQSKTLTRRKQTQEYTPTGKIMPRKSKAEIIEELSNAIENKLGNTKPRDPISYNAPQINRDTDENICEGI